jgi:hypothetical protein
VSEAVVSQAGQEAPDHAADRVPARAMVWVTWRQHRAAVAALVVLTACLAVVMLLAGLKGHAALSSCRESDACLHSQSSMFVTSPFDSYATGGYLLLLIPLLAGVFIGAPLLAGEFERGTFRFAWTQQLGARRWVTLKLALLGAVTAVLTGLLGLLYTWSYQPWVQAGQASGWLGADFNVTGLTLACWTLLGLAAGVLAGMVFRRTVTAMAVTAAVLVALGIAAVQWGPRVMLRWAALTTRFPPWSVAPNEGPGPITVNNYQPPRSGRLSDAWVTRGWYTGPGPRPMTVATYTHTMNALPQTSAAAQSAWLTRHHEAFWVAYQPASRFWLFQSGFGLVLVLLALALTATALYLVHRRVG